MPEIIVPCPSCDASLLVDEQNAGHEVICPGCNTRLTLPKSLDPGTNPEAQIAPVAKTGAVPAAPSEPARKNHPLYRSGHMGPLPETAAVPVPAQNRPAHLPERRGLSAEEEMRRLAALTADPGSFDLHNVDTKGRTAFPCPGCNRPVWMARSDWGKVLVCGGCNQEVIAPDPGKGIPAQLANNDGQEAQRQRTVIPGRRQVENVPLDEQAAGRPRRQGGQLPPAREAAAPAGERQGKRLPEIEPIPARGDVELAPSLKKGPPARQKILPQEQAAAAAEFGDSNALPLAPSGDMAKPLQRLSPERAPNFTPKHEADLSAEATGNWGGNPSDSNTPGFRRTLTLAIITLGLGAILVTGFMLRSYFSPRDHTAPAPEDNPTKNVELGKEALTRFFNAKTVEEMAKEVRHPEITLPRMKSFYAQGGIPRQKVDFTIDWREQDNWARGGVDFIFTTLSIDGSKEMAASLEIPKDGSALKLDWESFVAWSEMPWSEFLKTTSEKPGDFRVTITPIDYYNGFYSDRTKYHAFLVKDAGNFGTCYAYCDVNSALGAKLHECVREARKIGQVVTPTGAEVEQGLARVILRLHFLPEGKKFNQATIDALVWNDWLVP